MTDNPTPRSAARTTLVHCGLCGQWARGPVGVHACMACLKDIGKQVRCLDCDSHVYLIISDDEAQVSLRHDETCPAWLRFCRDNDHPVRQDIVWGPSTPPQTGR
jgi:hypothetical protein